MNCHYCPEPAVYVVELRDDDSQLPACRAHFADAYDEGERLNARSFLPVHVGRVAELVLA